MAAGILAAAGAGAVTPMWMRDVQISPDGEQIAFCYKGDIFCVSAEGGTARRLTTLDSYEQTPVWSPDGRQIAFSSDRYGNFDIFVMSAEGGAATRLTFNSQSEVPMCFDAAGENILFSAEIQAPAASIQFPNTRAQQVYSVPVSGGKTVQVMGTPALALQTSPKGDFYLYQDSKGMENTWRKHHVSSVTRDIWKYDVRSGRHTNLTQRPGEDLNPVLGADGKTVYMLSEPQVGDGYPTAEGWKSSINVWSFPMGNPWDRVQVSSFDTHPVRFLSRGGDRLCYTWNGEIYTQIPGREPAKVAIDLMLDEENIPARSTLTSGATEASVSPDGKQIAFVLHGEVFVTSVDYKTTRRLTTTPQRERGVCFGHDNRSVVYASDRSGTEQLYIARIARKEDANFPNATLITEEPLFPDAAKERTAPQFSPDGKKLAFIEDRVRLMVADMESGKISQVTDGSQWYDLGDPFHYDWSTDSRWLTLEFVPNGHDPYYNIGLVSVEGGPVIDLTGSGYMSGQPRFTLDGQAILFICDRYGMRSHASWGSQDDVFLCFLNQEAYDRFRLSKEDFELQKELKKSPKADAKKADKAEKGAAGEADEQKAVKSVEVETEGIQDRIVRVTPMSSSLSSAIVSKDGETLYFTASFEDAYDLWKCDLRKKETKLVSKGAGRGDLAADALGKTLFLLGSTLKKIDGDNLKPIAFSAELKIDRAAERSYMFDYVASEEQKRFYCEEMHGVDWPGYCEAYRRFLPHIADNYDFSEMLSELLGELNVSHTGSGYRKAVQTESTAFLGLLYDLSYKGQGLKVAEIIQDGPFDKAHLNLKAGDVITRIDGLEITDEQDVSLLLAGKTGKKTLIEVKGKEAMTVVPVSAAAQRTLLYKRWVKRQAAEVERLSGGRLGYVHIQGMNDASFRTVYTDLMGKYYQCEGVVIDQRYNGGGRLHEDIEVLFGGEKYLTQVVRGREACDMPSRRWNKPSIMLQCESDYSNAHGTPWVYSHMKLGKLVGAPVPGTMTSVNWVDLIDDSMYFGIPIIGYRTAEGTYLENSQLEPDIRVLNTPEQVAAGEDAQLKAAVKALLDEIDGQRP